jgi:hypothetical protein
MTDAPNPTGASKLDFLWRFRISQLTHPTTVVAVYFRTYPRGQKPDFAENIRYKPQKPQKPGFFGFDASRTIGFKADRPYSLQDVAALGLMTEFYRHLRSQPIKAEALRKAQLATIHKQIVVKDGQLRGTESAIDLTQSEQVANSDFSHPKFWAGFTIIGSPW